jgi:SAM-dependent methyltransferase
LLAPLRAEGVEIVNSDLKAEAGIDVAGDILDPMVRDALGERGFRCILAANLLEHVPNPAAVAGACEEIVGPGGLILVSVPESYPYHADPLDSGLRPSPDALAALFTRSVPLARETVVGGSFADEIRTRGSSVRREALRTLAFALIAFARPKSFRARAHRWLWYRRPYRVSLALLSVDSSTG